MARLIRLAVVLLILVVLGLAGWRYARDYIRDHPQDVPWTALRLDDPVGRFTLRKLAALEEDPALCRRLLAEARSGNAPAPPRSDDASCGYSNGMRLIAAPGEAALMPAGLVTSCPVAAALTIWERQVVQPAAKRHFDSRAAAIENAGSYSCRRLYGRSEGAFSEHATANAIDITGFRLADGTRIGVLSDWASPGPKSAFLGEVRDGACGLFATALSPDYNRAHADHLHFDMASRGRSGFSVCR